MQNMEESLKIIVEEILKLKNALASFDWFVSIIFSVCKKIRDQYW